MNKMFPIKVFISILSLQILLLTPVNGQASDDNGTYYNLIKNEVQSRPGQSAVYVLEHGEESLIARAWLTNQAQRSIDVQYFIWSTDNIGILASEALLRAAERGVRIRVIVDDLTIDAPDKTLLALSKHPNVNIRIYNPKHSVGTPLHKRIANLFTDFRGFNQRMHDKTFTVDNMVVITGGRNMADEYYDYNNDYNFRDRDALLLGSVANSVTNNFETFWKSALSISVEELYDGIGIMQRNVSVTDKEVQDIYQSLHDYANLSENFSPEVRYAISNARELFPAIADSIKWTNIEFISDVPGKNDSQHSFDGGGRTTTRLAKLLNEAGKQVIIQSPYLVLTDNAEKLFKELIARGVEIKIITNSLASTDNLQAFGGYLNQRKSLLKMGIQIFEYKNNPEIQKRLMQRYPKHETPPTFAIHAKTMIIDSKMAYIGTFNLDPRSINLNTEVGVIIDDEHVAKQVSSAIEQDMLPENSWDVTNENPNKHNSWIKRSRATFWRLMPIKPLL